jgi:hypothetical protein
MSVLLLRVYETNKSKLELATMIIIVVANRETFFKPTSTRHKHNTNPRNKAAIAQAIATIIAIPVVPNDVTPEKSKLSRPPLPTSVAVLSSPSSPTPPLPLPPPEPPPLPSQDHHQWLLFSTPPLLPPDELTLLSLPLLVADPPLLSPLPDEPSPFPPPLLLLEEPPPVPPPDEPPLLPPLLLLDVLPPLSSSLLDDDAVALLTE